MQLTNKRLTTIDIQMAKDQTPLVCLTCYTAPVAKLLDMQTDILLVGDSLGHDSLWNGDDSAGDG